MMKAASRPLDGHSDTSTTDLRVPTRLLPPIAPQHPLYELVLKLATPGALPLEVRGDVRANPQRESSRLEIRMDFGVARHCKGALVSGRVWVSTGKSRAAWSESPFVETPDHPHYIEVVSTTALNLEVPTTEVGAHIVTALDGRMIAQTWLKRPIAEIDEHYWPIRTAEVA